MAFTLKLPARIIFGRGTRRQAASETLKLGTRVLVVRGRAVAWVDDFEAALQDAGAAVERVSSSGEPSYGDLIAALAHVARFQPDCVVAVGGGAAIDLGKALAALAPTQGDPRVYFEIVGEGRPLPGPPLPFVAIPTTAGTGAEATKNAVISFPEEGRKVSLRDDRMVPDLALVDPALTDRCPRAVTLASGLDAVTQVIEPYLCRRANILTDALCRDAIPRALAALVRLMEAEDPDARDDLARSSLVGGIVLANAGLGAVHGLAGVIGGQCGAAHGALCGRLLPGVLSANFAASEGLDALRGRFHEVSGWLASALGIPAPEAFDALQARIDLWGLPRLEQMGFDARRCAETARLAQSSSSMAANPVDLSVATLTQILRAAL